jgi:hypothetical protein
MPTRTVARTLESLQLDRKDVETMIDWESDTWGGTVHLAANGSWVTDKHPHGTDVQD